MDIHMMQFITIIYIYIHFHIYILIYVYKSYIQIHPAMLPLSFVATGGFNSFSFPGSVKEVVTPIKWQSETKTE